VKREDVPDSRRIDGPIPEKGWTSKTAGKKADANSQSGGGKTGTDDLRESAKPVKSP
jgi:hypothetical protein